VKFANANLSILGARSKSVRRALGDIPCFRIAVFAKLFDDRLQDLEAVGEVIEHHLVHAKDRAEHF
jgi:hypothetical protein